jgi:hypothetical protein
MQGFFLGFSCFSLHPTRAQVEPEPRQGLTAAVPRGGFGCGKIEAHEETRAPRRLTFIVNIKIYPCGLHSRYGNLVFEASD